MSRIGLRWPIGWRRRSWAAFASTARSMSTTRPPIMASICTRSRSGARMPPRRCYAMPARRSKLRCGVMSPSFIMLVCAISPARTIEATGWICGATWHVWGCGFGWRLATSMRLFQISRRRSITAGISRSPVFALVGLRMPEDARPHFVAFQGQRQVEHVIANEPQRVATAWIGATVMLGAEDSGGTHRFDDQFHPATIHWLIEDGVVGWIRLRHSAPADARAERNQLAIVCTARAGGDQEFMFQIAAPQIDL